MTSFRSLRWLRNRCSMSASHNNRANLPLSAASVLRYSKAKCMARQMTVRIWLPPGYADAANITRKYPTLYLLDRQNAFDECTTFKGEHELRVDEAVISVDRRAQNTANASCVVSRSRTGPGSGSHRGRNG